MKRGWAVSADIIELIEKLIAHQQALEEEIAKLKRQLHEANERTAMVQRASEDAIRQITSSYTDEIHQKDLELKRLRGE